jgi:nitrogen fixation/metabolism regulation signal transduction histidine kinase
MERWLESFAAAGFRRGGDTAHDLKTPLNVAVLNLELLRMRLRKIAGDDEKVDGYARAIEVELRRLGQIFDAFFLLSTPPKNASDPGDCDVAKIARQTASSAGIELESGPAFSVCAHEARIRQALRLFFEGAAKLLRPDGRTAGASSDGDYCVTVAGFPAVPDLELSKVFKFYYTDPDGNPDLSLASARLIAETYGGALTAASESEGESDKVVLRFSVPPGEK